MMVEYLCQVVERAEMNVGLQLVSAREVDGFVALIQVELEAVVGWEQDPAQRAWRV
jgi:hypothetical protein